MLVPKGDFTVALSRFLKNRYDFMYYNMTLLSQMDDLSDGCDLGNLKVFFYNQGLLKNCYLAILCEP